MNFIIIDIFVIIKIGLFIKFFNAALNQGIYFAPSKYEAGFISSTHDQSILQQTKNKIKLAIKEL